MGRFLRTARPGPLALALAFVLAIGPIACARPRPSEPLASLAGRIWDPQRGQSLSEEALVARLAEARWVLLGEKHDSPEHHRIQGRLIEALAARGRRPVVAFEMLSADAAPALARALAESSPSAEGVRRAVAWDESGWPAWPLYAPVFEAALGAGLPLATADLPRALLADLRRGGLAGLSTEDRVRLALDRPVGPALRDALAEEIDAAHCGVLPAQVLPLMVDVQLARDAHLARSLVDAAGDGTGVLVAGNGHVRHTAVPRFLARQPVAGRVFALGLLEARPDERDPVAALAARGLADVPYDAVWWTTAVDDEDPCEKFRESLESLRQP